MDRFGLIMTKDELDLICEGIRSYEPAPVHLSHDGMKSYHPINFKGVQIVVLYDWSLSQPITVYRTGWFDKISETEWVPNSGKRKKAKEIRNAQKKKAFYERIVKRDKELKKNEY